MTEVRSETQSGHLVLLTSSFPFGTGESFLADELPLLAARFARLTIVSESAEGGASPRQVPSNCQVVTVAPGDATPSWLLKSRAWPGILEALRDGRGSQLRKRLSLLRSAAHYVKRASAVTSAARRQLGGGAASAGPICFYSYWMDHKALAATLLQREHAGSIAVSRAHGYDLYEERHPYSYLPFRRYLLSRLDAVFAIADAGARHLHERFPTGLGKVTTSRLGVPLGVAATAAGCPQGQLRVLSIGSLIPLKRISLLIDSLAAWGAESGVSWSHLGDGPLREGLLEQARERLRIPYTIAGQVPHQELRGTLRREASCALLVNTSTTEGIPVSMMEAMACGIPCVGTAVGGVAEIVEDGVNGYLLPAHPSPSAVCDVIERFRSLTSTQQAAMRRAAFDTWSAKYDANANYARFADVLAARMGGSPAA